jgi:hypothetical protein
MDLQLATFLVALLVAIISILNYLSTREKIAIDLFDRRLKVFEEAEAAASGLLLNGEQQAQIRGMTNAMVYSRFLFGEDVENYLDSLRKDLIYLNVYSNVRDANDAERVARADRLAAATTRVTDFAKTSPAIFGPYMRVRHKIQPWWQFWKK